MTRSASTLRALAARVSAPGRSARNGLWARRAAKGALPARAETLPNAVQAGKAEIGYALATGSWPILGHRIEVADKTLWDAQLGRPHLEAARQSWVWLDDLAALGNRRARRLAQQWVMDWIRSFGAGSGPGWTPEIAGLRAMRWSGHAAMLTQGLDPAMLDRFWRGLAGQQRYLAQAWPEARPGIARMRAQAGLVWTGRVLPHPGHDAACHALGQSAEALIGSHGGLVSRDPEELAEVVLLLVWAARMLEDADKHPSAAHLAAIGRSVPVLRQLRMGDGGFGRFHGGGPGAPARIDQALAELRLGVQPKPRLPMGYARLSGGRTVVVMDAAAPPRGTDLTAHAGTLAFEFSVGRQPVVVNAGPGGRVDRRWATAARETAAHSTVEIDGQSSARIETQDLAARTFGPRLVAGPTLVTVRQAQDASGMWLLATHDGYVASHGLLHERRAFVDARGTELRGEEILTVTDARARAQFDRAAAHLPQRAIPIAARFHLHPAIEAEHDDMFRQIRLTLPSGEVWAFRAAGGSVEIGGATHFDPDAAAPVRSRQVVVRTEAVEYLGQITWSFTRLSDATVLIGAPREADRTEPQPNPARET